MANLPLLWQVRTGRKLRYNVRHSHANQLPVARCTTSLQCTMKWYFPTSCVVLNHSCLVCVQIGAGEQLKTPRRVQSSQPTSPIPLLTLQFLQGTPQWAVTAWAYHQASIVSSPAIKYQPKAPYTTALLHFRFWFRLIHLINSSSDRLMHSVLIHNRFYMNNPFSGTCISDALQVVVFFFKCIILLIFGEAFFLIYGRSLQCLPPVVKLSFFWSISRTSQ